MVESKIVHVVMLDSEFTRSTAVGVNTACPHEDLAPLMDQGRRQEFEEGGAELFAPETTWRGAPKIPVTGSHTP